VDLGHRRSYESLVINRGGAVLLAIGLVDSIGTGLYLAGSALFFTLVIGLKPAEVGVGLSAAGVVGLVAQPAVGWAADRWGPRRALIVVNLMRAAGFVAYVFTHSFPVFVVVAAFLGVGEQAVVPVFQALVALVVGPGRRVGMMARVRATYNVGYTVGGLLAGAAVAIGTRQAFDAILVGNAVSFVVAAVLLPTVPLLAPADGGGARPRAPFRLRGLRDTRYVVVAGINAVLVLHIALLSVGVPLWVTLHTSAPHALVPVLFVVNTIMTVFLQVPVARGSKTVRGSTASLRKAGAVLALCCAVFAVAPHLGAKPLVVACLLVGICVQTMGEILQSAGGWGLSYMLAPERSQAEYLATFNMGTGLQYAVGPTLVTLGVVDHGTAGWLTLGVVFGLAASAVPWAVARAESRPVVAVD
jgi:MFS family permease